MLWARVDFIGRIIDQKGVTATRLGSGSYQVSFPVDVSACAVTVTLIRNFLSFDPDPVTPRLVTFGTEAQVELRQGFGNTDAEFSIVANCA